MTARQKRANRTGVTLGLAASLLAVGVYWTGILDPIEWITLDRRFRYANSTPARDDLVYIAIGDRDLDLIGRWPWPRDQQAALLSIPGELGARALLVDITYLEGEERRLADVADLPDGASSGPLDPTPDDVVYPDPVLRAAIERANPVHLAFHYPAWDVEQSAEFQRAVDLLLADRIDAARAEAHRLEDRLRREIDDPEDFARQRPFVRARLAAMLVRDPELDETTLIDALGVESEADRAFVRDAYQAAREAALRRRIRNWLAEDPQRNALPARQISRAIYAELTDRPFENVSALRKTLDIALRQVLSYEATAEASSFRAARTPGLARHVDGIMPVYYLHARAAARCGFVNYEYDEDGVVRRMRLAVEHRGNIFTQLAFSLACEQLGVDENAIRVSGRWVTIERGPDAPPLHLQLDGEGRTMVPWVAEPDWRRQFAEPVPASALWSIAEHRRLIERNERGRRAALAELLTDPFFDEHELHRKDVRDLFDLERQVRAARLADAHDVGMLEGFRAELEKIVAEREARGVEKLEGAFAALPDAGRRTEAQQHVAALHAQLEEVRVYERANERLRRVADETVAWVRERVEDRICLVGYTATSLADMVPLPVHPRAPGVVAHANLLNGLLEGRAVYWATVPVNTAIALLFGLVISVVSTLRRPVEAGLWVLGMLLAFVAVAGWAAFYYFSYWIALTPAVGAGLLAYVLILGYRYVFLDSERRQLTTALSQYTSKEIARQVAENPELCRRAETREVTAMFTDLRGFTSISERIGAGRTQRVLNVCLGRFTDVMLQHEAMVNKFIGDGIFAFWNPVIYPQADHALRACETAVDLQVALANLRVEQKQQGGDDVFDELWLRIGVASGSAVVGPCGSEQKYDYTCIGDSVNVAARLESANKFYGTNVLVSGSARDQTDGRFVFRPLGGVRVKGKRQAVPIFELVGRAGEVSSEEADYAEAFGTGVELFQRRDWQAAREVFARCAGQRQDDLAAQRYCEATAAFLREAPADDWQGALELSEK